MESQIVYKGKKVSFYDKGEGNIIVLLHGYLESSLTWGSFSESLAEKYRVISVDLPGHGKSETLGEIHTMEYMAEAVSEVLNILGATKVFIAGHSLGGYVAIAFLELFPEKLNGYCLFHSHPFADSEAAIEKRRREIKVVQAGKKNLMYPDNVTRMFADSNLKKYSVELDRAKVIASKTPGEGIIAVLNGMMTRPSRVSLFEKSEIPVLWLLGRMDNYIDCDSIIKRVNLPEKGRLAILEGSGHLGFIEEEKVTVGIVSDFADSVFAGNGNY